MIRRAVPVLAASAILVTLIACGTSTTSQGGSSEDAQATGTSVASEAPASVAQGPGESAAASVGSANGNGLASVTLHIDAGDRAGDYTATIVGSGGCSRGTFGPSTFAVSSVDVEATGGFDGPQMTIFDTTGAADGTDQFGVAFGFDNFATNLLMSPYEGFGSGTLTLDDRGATATIHAEGTLEDGSAATVDIECHTVAGF